MHYNVTGNESDGWLLVFYTKGPAGGRTVFEVSERLKGVPREVAVATAQERLKDLRQAAESCGGHFPTANNLSHLLHRLDRLENRTLTLSLTSG